MYVLVPSNIFFFILGSISTIAFLFIIATIKINKQKREFDKNIDEIVKNLKEECENKEDDK